MAVSKEILVRVETLSKRTATVRGLREGRSRNGSALSVSATSKIASCSAPLRSSSIRKCLIATPRSLVEKRRQHTDEAVELVGADDQRRRQSQYIGSGALMTKPAASAVSTTAEAIGSAKSTACSRPRPRTPLINR